MTFPVIACLHSFSWRLSHLDILCTSVGFCFFVVFFFFTANHWGIIRVMLEGTSAVFTNIFFSVRIQHCSTMGSLGCVTHSLILFAHLWGHFSVILTWQTCLNEGSSNGVVDKRTTNIYRSCCTLLGKTSRR